MPESSRQRVSRASLNTLNPLVLGRLLMAASGLVALNLDPPEFSLAPGWVMPLLFAYAAFAVLALLQEILGSAVNPALDWVDLVWGVALTVVTGGTSSVLFFFLLLPIIARSFREGFEPGWRMALYATGAFLAFGLPASPGGILFEFNRALTRPLTLIILGYVIAREGGAQHRALRQLALLAAINAVGNPRLGADRTLTHTAARIRDTYAVDECLIVLCQDADEPCLLVRASAQGEKVERYPRAAVEALLALPDEAAVLCRPHAPLTALHATPDALSDACDALVDLLDCAAFLSVPLRRVEGTVGRIFVLDRRLAGFGAGELVYFEKAAEQLMLVIERIRLLDQLGAMAAQRERRRLAHDLHDLAIQPYLGVQLGLSALQRRPECPPALVGDLHKLQQLAQQGVSELRGLLESRRAEDDGDVEFSEALARVTQHYADQFGIQVDVQVQPGLDVQGTLAGEVLAIVLEGLSNVRRHTAATRAGIRLDGNADQLRVEIRNPNAGVPAPPFVPRSISARVRELGGDGAMESDRDGHTVLSLRIPR